MWRAARILLWLPWAAIAARAQVPDFLTPGQFAALSAEFSEPSGFFDTDNLVSNEDSYLHAVTGFAKYGVAGGAYVGVGPDQNFSYIAALKPHIAFIVDIRRDNLLEHLLFKALFARASNRVEYLCFLFGKPIPGDPVGWSRKSLEELLDYVSGQPADSRAAERAHGVVRAELRRSAMPLTPKDLETIRRFHSTFIASGPALKLTSYGRPEREDYPDYRRLLLETDLNGRPANYLAREADFRFVKSLEDRNLVIPVVGDFAGTHALASIGDYLKDHSEHVSVFYTSNVEQYLFRGTLFAQFTSNVAHLPHDSGSVIVRSYFGYGRPHPQWRRGYLSVQLLQRIDVFMKGRYANYRDLVSRDYLTLP
ncbi:MAG: hypothetical protein EXR93_08605 [Gemmatimonadetes bacterium]|nr:hypothetical protein [Gemmatimonadota bacterium]